MADYYQMILDSRAKKLLNKASQMGLDYRSVMKEAAKAGVADNPSVLNFVRTLKSESDIGRQKEITGAVGRATATTTPKGLDEALSTPPREFAQKIEANPQNYQGTEGIKTEEQFYNALGRETLSPETSFQDVQDNPAYQFARGALPSEGDELAKARIKIQQDAEARKKKQIDEQNKLGDLKLRLQDRDLAWKYYNAGVNAQKPEFENADNWDAKAEEASVDLGEAESTLDKWKTIKGEINKQGSEYFGAYTPEQVNAGIAAAETLARNAKIQHESWHKKASEIRKLAYERGMNISRGSRKTFIEPKPAEAPAAAPAPAQSSMLKREEIAKSYGID